MLYLPPLQHFPSSCKTWYSCLGPPSGYEKKPARRKLPPTTYNTLRLDTLQERRKKKFRSTTSIVPPLTKGNGLTLQLTDLQLHNFLQPNEPIPMAGLLRIVKMSYIYKSYVVMISTGCKKARQRTSTYVTRCQHFSNSSPTPPQKRYWDRRQSNYCMYIPLHIANLLLRSRSPFRFRFRFHFHFQKFFSGLEIPLKKKHSAVGRGIIEKEEKSPPIIIGKPVKKLKKPNDENPL